MSIVPSRWFCVGNSASSCIILFLTVYAHLRTTSSADCSARRISHLHALCISAVIFCTCLIAEPGASLQYLFGELVLGLDFVTFSPATRTNSNVCLGNVHILCSCYFVYGTINIMISYGVL
ncbi:uncharacterized protein BJ212DRAFT_886546 [Suillus subaureus]|uniref:Uncharacterized protein n=1 Tax=Suillus subaureus TaxID=48587 RepID=A0A9P7AL36_9AGAM|nr:uncharacterized protein BJ212DRAFT_886546 [Suillus subaureus]KAG1791649.1 hypothetical protein BJ212DRAFT_886546 [Suillus subaureus]